MSVPDDVRAKLLPCPFCGGIAEFEPYKRDGDPWKEDARAMGEMDINDFARDGRQEKCRAALAQFAALAKGEEE